MSQMLDGKAIADYNPSLMPDTPSRERLHFGPRNYAALGAALVCLVAGYVSLNAGSTTLAPVLLVLGYLVFIPVGLAL